MIPCKGSGGDKVEINVTVLCLFQFFLFIFFFEWVIWGGASLRLKQKEQTLENVSRLFLTEENLILPFHLVLFSRFF